MYQKRKISMVLILILVLQIICPTLTVIWENGLTIKSIATDTENSWDVSENQDGSIIATFDNTTRTLSITGTGNIKKESFNINYPWYGKHNNIIKICISDGIENVPTRAFEEYRKLKEVSLGNNIKVIGYEAFHGCKLLNKINLPDGLQNIDRAAFQSCVGLTSITIPDSVNMIGQKNSIQYGDYQFDVFRGCANLQSISVGENNVNYSSVDGVLFNKDKTILVFYPEGKKTTEYTIPSTVTKVGAYSMYNVTNVTKINVPNGVATIGAGGFRGCINLTNINFPASLEVLDEDVFDDCTKLKSITVDVNNANYSSVNGVLFNKDKTTILIYPIGKEDDQYTIPNSVTTIDSGAFRLCSNLKNIEIPNSVVNIEWFAFSGCTGLTEITIPDSVNKMGSEIYEMHFGYIFEGCENLKSVTLPAQIDTFYSNYTFKNCSSLEKIIIPEGTEYIGNSAFQGCNSLTSVELPESVISIHSSAFQDCNSLTSIKIPSYDPILPNGSFHATGLEILDIPTGITTIGNGAFTKCRNLKEINIPDTVTKISEGAFRGALLTVKVETNSNESYEIELPEVIKRTIDSSDILYSKDGFYLTNCTLREDKIVASKDMLEQGKVILKVRSGTLYGLEVSFESTTYSDTVAPVIDYYDGPDSAVYGIGDKISIRIRLNEYIKGAPPKLIIKFGDGEEKIVTAIDNWSTGSTNEIEFSYIVEAGDNGLLKIISVEAEGLTDWTGNKLVKEDNPKLDETIVANTKVVANGVIKEEYHITNKDELKNIEELVTSGTFDLLGSTIYLENDIDLGCSEDNQWIPIGTVYNPFRGTFEGKGHKITGIYINSEENYQGLFGYSSGTIKNVSLENSYIYSTGNYIGGITGCNYDKATIENCYNGAKISGNYYVGGISGGNNNPYSGEIKIINCYNLGEIVGNSSIGGIIGKTWLNNYIQGSYNSGNVSGNDQIGGIVGDMSGSDEYTSEISNCYNTGKISSNRIVGGIVGTINGDNNNIKYCYNIGNIKGNGSSWPKGSIVGKKWSGIIKNCYYSNISGIKAVENKDDETNKVYGLESSYMKTEDFVNILNSNNEESNIWKLAEENYEYPVLSWQTIYPDFTEEISLTGIAVTKAPYKVSYIAGQNFNKSGMVVTASYNDGTSKEVTNYTVTDGNNLTAGKTSVTISYTENGVTKTVTQNITVIAKKLTGITVTKAPNDINYIAGQNFDKTGMKVTATYNDGSTKEVTNFTVTDGNNLSVGKTSVTISYTEDGVTKTTTQSITVTEKLEITLETYEEKQEGTEKYLENIMQKTTVREILEKIKTNGKVEIYKGTTKITDLNANIATGMTLKISLNSESAQYTIVVTGDVNGDGKVSTTDITKIKKHIIQKESLEGCYKRAADVKEDEKISVTDLAKMKKVLVGLITF